MTPNTLYVGVGWARAAWRQAWSGAFGGGYQDATSSPVKRSIAFNGMFAASRRYYAILDAATLALERGQTQVEYPPAAKER